MQSFPNQLNFRHLSAFQTRLVVPFTMLWTDGTKTYRKFHGVTYGYGSLNSSATVLSH